MATTVTITIPEKRLALIHRVIVPDEECPKEYAILVTGRRSIFIHQPKTRRTFVLRYEMKVGTALVTDVAPKTLEDYEQTSLETIAADGANLTIQHEAVIWLAMKADPPELRRRDFFLRVVMNRQKEVFQVYNFELSYRQTPNHEATIKFYAVPLGAYFKPKRQTQNRETILREYAQEALEIYRQVLPANIISSQPNQGETPIS